MSFNQLSTSEIKETLQGLAEYMKIISNDIFFQKDFTLFSYDEIICSYFPASDYYIKIASQLSLPQQQLSNIEKLNKYLHDFDQKMAQYEKKNCYNLEISILKDISWHHIQDIARSILKSLNNKTSLTYIRILESRLCDQDYIEDQYRILLKTHSEITSLTQQETSWPDIEKYCRAGGFLDLYYRFSVKAEVILKHFGKFQLTNTQKDSLNEFLLVFDEYYHTVVKRSLKTKDILNDTLWHKLCEEAKDLHNALRE